MEVVDAVRNAFPPDRDLMESLVLTNGDQETRLGARFTRQDVQRVYSTRLPGAYHFDRI